MRKKGRICESDVEMRVEYDPDPDTSWMRDDQLDDYQSGLLVFVGVYAEIDAESDEGVSIKARSGGLWGIDTMHRKEDNEYLESVFEEEKAALIKELRDMGWVIGRC